MDNLEPVAGTVAYGTILGTYAGVLPDASTILALVYLAIKIYQTETFQDWKSKHKRWYIAAFGAAGALLMYSFIRLLILAGRLVI